MTVFLLIIQRVILALSCVPAAATLHWATTSHRQSRRHTFFGARVEQGFAESKAGRAVLSEFRRRLWLWSLAGGAASLIVRINFAMFVSGTAAATAGVIAFGLANRRIRSEAAPAAAPVVRVASLETADEQQPWWLGLVDWLAMLVPPAMPAAIFVFRSLHLRSLPTGAFGKLGIFFTIAGLILGLLCSANHWALLYRARSSDWAPAPGTSRKYRTYLGALQSLGFAYVIYLLCGFFIMPTGRAFTYFSIMLPVQAVWMSGVFRMRSWLTNHFATGSVDPMPDSCWKWGSFYFNPDDPAIMVPLRTGLGQSMNFARPSAWAANVLLIAVTIGLLVATAKLALPDY